MSMEMVVAHGCQCVVVGVPVHSWRGAFSLMFLVVLMAVQLHLLLLCGFAGLSGNAADVDAGSASAALLVHILHDAVMILQ